MQSAIGELCFSAGKRITIRACFPSLFRDNAPQVPRSVAELAGRFDAECYGISSWDEIESKRLKDRENSYNPIGGLFFFAASHGLGGVPHSVAYNFLS